MKRKALLISLSVALVALMALGFTLAYFTDTADATNTFTVGNVDIDLTEESWNPNENKLIPGVTLDKDPTITLLEGSEDAWIIATITVSNWSAVEDMMTAHGLVDHGLPIFCGGTNAVLSGGIASSETTTYNANIGGLGAGYENTAIAVIGSENASDDTMTYTVYFKTAFVAGGTKTLFTTVTMPTDATSDEMKAIDGYTYDATNQTWINNQSPFTITIHAYAIQTAGLADVFVAYDAYNTQNP